MAKGERVLLTEPGVRLTLTRSEAIELYRALDDLDYEFESDELMCVMSALNIGLYPTAKSEGENDDGT